MIFSVEGHILKIMSGEKTQTRRASDKYKVGNLYSIQAHRGAEGIPDGKILILAKREEIKTPDPRWYCLLENEAQAEGGYTPEEYEELYEKMHPGWENRHSYLFEYVRKKGVWHKVRRSNGSETEWRMIFY